MTSNRRRVKTLMKRARYRAQWNRLGLGWYDSEQWFRAGRSLGKTESSLAQLKVMHKIYNP